jgi:hypothetical protein
MRSSRRYGVSRFRAVAALVSVVLLAVSVSSLPAQAQVGSMHVLPGYLIGSGFAPDKFYVRQGEGSWELTYTPGWQGEGFGEQVRGTLLNLRSANAVFDDESGRVRQYDRDFDPQVNTDAFIARLDEYRAHGLLANDVNLQGGNPGFSGALNSAFNRDGSLRQAWMDRAAQVIEAHAERNMVVVLGYFYFHQDQYLADENAVRLAVVNATDWLIENNYRNVIIEIANEYNDQDAYDHEIIRSHEGMAELIELAQSRFDDAGFRLAVSASRFGDALWPNNPVAEAADLALVHCNGVNPATCANETSAAQRAYPYPIVVNETDNTHGVYTNATLNAEKDTLDRLTAAGVSWGLMHKEWNQYVTCVDNPNCGTTEFDWALGPNPGANGSGADLLRNFAHGVFDHLQSVVFGGTAPPAGNVALRKPATASSVETENGQQAVLGAERAVDGNTGTRWASQFSDPQWIRVDLGARQPISRVVLNWENAHGRAYELQVSDDDSTWTPVFSTTTGNGGIDDIALDTTGRYVRMVGTQRGTEWGYSLWEFEIYGEGGTQPPSDGDTAAERFGWGTPLSGPSDEFNYGSETAPAVPDQSKWGLAGGGVGLCWPGHANNGRRCDKNTRVHGGVLRLVGEANGDTGWLESEFGRQYGRWEARVRSMNTGAPNDRQYHPLLIIWPDGEDPWPEKGEYDYLENGSPGEDCAEAFIHYPHDPDVPTQQQFARETDCGAPLSEWHNVAFEWSSDHVAGFIDGREWFRFSGGANDVRQCIQCMPSGHQTIQLDNFHGAGMTPAIYEVDWYREYTAP